MSYIGVSTLSSFNNLNNNGFYSPGSTAFHNANDSQSLYNDATQIHLSSSTRHDHPPQRLPSYSLPPQHYQQPSKPRPTIPVSTSNPISTSDHDRFFAGHVQDAPPAHQQRAEQIRKAAVMGANRVPAEKRVMVDEFLKQQEEERERFCIENKLTTAALHERERGRLLSLKPETRWNYWQKSQTLKDWAADDPDIPVPIPFGHHIREQLYKSLDAEGNQLWKARFEEELNHRAEREIKELRGEDTAGVFEHFTRELVNKCQVLAIDHDIHVLGFATSSRAGDGLIATVGSSLGMAFALQKLGGELSAAQVFEEYVKGTVYVQNEKAREAESFIANYDPVRNNGSVDLKRAVVPVLFARQFRKAIQAMAEELGVKAAPRALPNIYYDAKKLKSLGFKVVVDQDIETQLSINGSVRAYTNPKGFEDLHFKLLIPKLREGRGVCFEPLPGIELTPDRQAWLEAGGATKRVPVKGAKAARGRGSSKASGVKKKSGSVLNEGTQPDLESN